MNINHVYHAAGILDGRHRLERIMSSVLAYRNDGRTTVQNVSIRLLLEGFAHVVQPLLQQLDGKLDVINCIPEANIEGEYEMLLGVLLNLFINALQEYGKGTIINIEVGPTANNDIEILFAVNGSGVRTRLIDRIFAPFFHDSVVLDLTVATAILEAHRGDIEVHAKPAIGTTYTLHLPTLMREQVSEVEDSLIYGAIRRKMQGESG
jgi:two-component system, sensor histidine kinase FlrB